MGFKRDINDAIKENGCPRCGSVASWHQVDHSLSAKRIVGKTAAAAALTFFCSPPYQTKNMLTEFHYECDRCGYRNKWTGHQFYRV